MEKYFSTGWVEIKKYFLFQTYFILCSEIFFFFLNHCTPNWFSTWFAESGPFTGPAHFQLDSPCPRIWLPNNMMWQLSFSLIIFFKKINCIWYHWRFDSNNLRLISVNLWFKTYYLGKVVFSCTNTVIILFWEPNFTYFKIDNVIRKYLENHALSTYVYFNTKNTLHLAS